MRLRLTLLLSVQPVRNDRLPRRGKPDSPLSLSSIAPDGGVKTDAELHWPLTKLRANPQLWSASSIKKLAFGPVPQIKRDRVGIAIDILAKRGVRLKRVVIARHARHRVVTEVKFNPASDVETVTSVSRATPGAILHHQKSRRQP